MTVAESVYHFLQVDKLKCANCGKQLNVLKGYYKMAMWPQYAFFTYRWLSQLYGGDNKVMRFCIPYPKPSVLDMILRRQPVGEGRDCFAEFASKGRLIEVEAQ